VFSFERARRGVGAASLAIGVLLGLNVAAMPQAAYALPKDPIEQCVPQFVSGADAFFNGTLKLLDPAIVGYESRLSLQGGNVQLPDPRCDGRYISVPLTGRWDLTARPTGSISTLYQLSTTGAKLTPDVGGSWQVTYTACPAGCRVTGTTITVPPLKKTLSFTSSVGIEGHVSSDFIDSTMKLFLADSRMQISHTGAGTNVNGVPYTVEYYPLSDLFKKLCLDPVEPSVDCDALLDKITESVEFRTITPTFSSFIDFGPFAESKDAPPFITLPVEVHEHEIPSWKRAALLAAQGFGGISGIDIDRARLLVNNIHLEFKDLGRWETSVSGGSVNIKMSFESSHPTIKCEAHYIHRVGFFFSVDSGWSDNLCPDYDLSQMDMTIKLFPVVQNDVLTLSNAQVEVQLTPQGLQSELIDVFFDASDEQEVKIAERVRAKLVEPENRARLGAVLTQVLKHRFPDLVRVRSSQILENDWVIRYER
jgi:hypothetical protein